MFPKLLLVKCKILFKKNQLKIPKVKTKEDTNFSKTQKPVYLGKYEGGGVCQNCRDNTEGESMFV